LCLAHPFYEQMNLGMQPEFLYPRRSRFAPSFNVWFSARKYKREHL
jgi:hypothetical protein